MEVATFSNKRRINEKNLLFSVKNLNDFIFSPENQTQVKGLVDHQVLEELKQSTGRLLAISLPDSVDRKMELFLFYICLSLTIAIMMECFNFVGFI